MSEPINPKFFEAYGESFGGRWPALLEALLAPFSAISLKGLRKEYWMDPASIWAAQLLDVQPDHEVLDLCAAPGGKTLVLALQMWRSGTPNGQLFANEVSSARRTRLKKVIAEHLSAEAAAWVKIMGIDGTRIGLQKKSSFDRILVDAPCSSERHVLHNPAELKKWSPARSRSLNIRQVALLCGAVDALRAGGRIVYSTCSLSDHENDKVVQRLLRKRPQVSVGVLSQTHAEKTEFGYQLLPDRAEGAGPMYAAILEKEGAKPSP